jgi:predicted ArsR family transcriptional regulator
LVALFTGLPQHLVAQEHVVSPDAIQQQLVQSAAQRSQNVDALHQFFGSASAQKTLKTAGISSVEVKNAVAQLSDQELAQLAGKAGRAQQDFAAGALTNQQITYILIALATAVIVIVLLKA